MPLVAEIGVILTLHAKIVFKSFCVLQLPSNINDSIISKLASLFTKRPLTKLALEYFEFSLADLENLEDDCKGDAKRFNTRLLFHVKCKAGNREVREETLTFRIGTHFF